MTEDDPSDFEVRIPSAYFNTMRHWASRLCQGGQHGPAMDRVRVALEEAADAATYRCAFFKRDDLSALDVVLQHAMKMFGPEDGDGPARPGETWCSTVIDEIYYELRKDAVAKLGELG